MTKSQKLYIIPLGASVEEATPIAIAEGCVGIFQGVPGYLLDEEAAEGGWTLPHIYTETWEEPDPPAPPDAGV